MLLIFSRSLHILSKDDLKCTPVSKVNIFGFSQLDYWKKEFTKKTRWQIVFSVSSYREMPDMGLRFSKPNNGSDPVVDRYIHSRLHTYNIHVSFSLSLDWSFSRFTLAFCFLAAFKTMTWQYLLRPSSIRSSDNEQKIENDDDNPLSFF